MAVKNTRTPPLPSVELRDEQPLTYVEAGAYLRCTARQVARLVEEGRLGSTKLSERRTRILGRHVREFLQAAEDRPADPLAAARPRMRARTRA